VARLAVRRNDFFAEFLWHGAPPFRSSGESKPSSLHPG